MSIKVKVCDVEHDDDDFLLGLILEDQLLFNQLIMPDELRLEPSIKQKMMFLDNSDNIILCTGRAVGKSTGLKGRILRDIATYIPEENSNMLYQVLVVTPSEVHLKPLIDETYDAINRNPFLSALCTKMSSGTTAQLDTKTHLRLFGRIEGMTTDSDRNMIGIHPYKIYGDELAFGSTFNHKSRVGGAQPGCKWVYAGVPSGNRNSPLYIYDQTRSGNEWSHHRLNLIQDNPQFIGNQKEIDKKIRDAGGEHSQDYKTQILGEWGDETSTTFPKEVQSWDKEMDEQGFPKDKYFIVISSSNDIRSAVKDQYRMPAVIRIPSIDCEKAVIGYDYGFSQDPATFLCAIKQANSNIWRTYCRLTLWNVLPEDQIAVLRYLVSSVFKYKVVMVSVDNAVVQSLMMNDNNIQYFNGKVKATGQGTVVEMDSITGLTVDDPLSDPVAVAKHREEGKVIKDGKKYWLTEQFKKYMYRYNIGDITSVSLKLGRDPELEDEMLSTTESRAGQRGNQTKYYVPKMKHGSRVDLDQNVDAARALTDCLVEVERSGNVLAPMNFTELIKSMGWAGKNINGEQYQAPWG